MHDCPETLSDRQRTCLRLVGRGMSSKEIAHEVGLSPQTVDTYIKAAMAKLGAGNRRDAARLLEAHELSQQLGSPPGAIAMNAAPADQAVATGGGGRLDWLLPPPVGGKSNDLSAAERTFAVLKVAGIGAVAVFALALLIAGTLYTLR